MPVSNYLKAFSPTHIVSIITAGATTIAVDLIPFIFGHPLSASAYIIVNSVGLVMLGYGSRSVVLSSSGVDITNKGA